MKTILFQGDSITDCGRNRQEHIYVGHGYPILIKSQLGFDYPEEYNFQNRGISGNRIVDVYSRIKADIINLKPDYMSLLIGVNDVWHEFDFGNGVSVEKYEKIYCMLIEEIKAELPDIKIIILEPFCLKGTATENNELFPNKWETFNAEVRERAKVAKRIAEKYDLYFVALQDKFDQLSTTAGCSYWLGDGVHPTAMGHELIKREWLKAFEAIK